MERQSAKQTRKTKTDVFDLVCKSFSTNLNTLLTEKTLNSHKLSKILEVNYQAVRSWELGEALPCADKLYKLAKYFGVTTDWLLAPNADFVERSNEIKTVTYADIFVIITKLNDCSLVDNGFIKDPFIHYLLEKHEQIKKMRMLSKEKRDAWYKKILNDYESPILDCRITDSLFDACLDMCTEINPDDSHLSCLRALQQLQAEATNHTLTRKYFRCSIYLQNEEDKWMKKHHPFFSLLTLSREPEPSQTPIPSYSSDAQDFYEEYLASHPDDEDTKKYHEEYLASHPDDELMPAECSLMDMIGTINLNLWIEDYQKNRGLT